MIGGVSCRATGWEAVGGASTNCSLVAVDRGGMGIGQTEVQLERSGGTMAATVPQVRLEGVLS